MSRDWYIEEGIGKVYQEVNMVRGNIKLWRRTDR